MNINLLKYSPGHFALAQLMPIIVNTTETAISRFAPIDRACYTQKEIDLKYIPLSMGYRYSPKNCLYAALLEKMFSNCSCISDFFRIGNEFQNILPCRYLMLLVSKKFFYLSFKYLNN
jgi:hypothetical protein